MRRKHLQTFRYVFSHCLSCIRKDSSPCKVLNLLVVGVMSKTYLNINADFLRPCSDLYDIVDFVQHCSTLYVLVRLRTNWLSYVRPCSTMLDIVGFVQICSILYDLFQLCTTLIVLPTKLTTVEKNRWNLCSFWKLLKIGAKIGHAILSVWKSRSVSRTHRIFN